MTEPKASDHPKGLVSFVLTSARALRPALLLASLIFIAILVYLAADLRSQLRLFQEEPVDNIHWNVTQLELDIVRFESEAERTLLLPDAGMGELRTRFDLFYSRAQSALQGRMFEQLGLSDVVVPMNQALKTFLLEVTPLIDGDDASLRQALPTVQQKARNLHEELRVMSVDLIDKYAALADQRRAKFANLLRAVAVGSAILVAVLILLLGLVMWLNRQATRNMDETRRVSVRLAATVDTSLDAIIVADRDGRVMDYNSAAERIFGYSRQDAIGNALSDLIIPKHHRQAHLAGMERMNRTGKMTLVNTGRFQITAIRKGGEEFPIEMSLASSEEDGRILFISYLRDISYRLAAEQAVIAARDRAMAAEQAKTNFMAVMSHEMRTPLNGVMAALEISSRKTVDEKQARFLEIAHSSAQQLLRHANEILDISKIDAGRLNLSEGDFDLPPLVDSLVEALEHLAAQRNSKITVKALSAVPRLHGDSFRLAQIVQNFLSNAIKFTQDGLIRVEYEVESQSCDEVSIELRVTDTGIGIAEEDQARVFDDFVMIDPSYGRTAGGTGLGLAISRRLATALGGEIGVESDLGEGSCFWLRIPFAKGADAAPADEALAAVAQTASKDILVVEDNATNRIVLEEMLQTMGHRVTLAVDGGEGLAMARAHAYEVILMDISMPVMDGLTVTKEVRRDGASKGARIIAVTAHSAPADRERFAAAGMDGFLTKPISCAALMQAIEGDSIQTTPNEPQVAILSVARLDELRAAMGQDGFNRIFTQFRQELPKVLTRLDQAARIGQLGDLKQAAHEGAGSCAMVGASRLGTHLAQVEAACNSGDAVSAVALAAQADSLWQATLSALDARARCPQSGSAD